MCKFKVGEVVIGKWSKEEYEIRAIHVDGCGNTKYDAVLLRTDGKYIGCTESNFIEKTPAPKFKAGDRVYNAVLGTPERPATVTRVGEKHPYKPGLRVWYRRDDDGYEVFDHEDNIELLPEPVAPKVGDLILITSPIFNNKTYGVVVDKRYSASNNIHYTVIEADNPDIEEGMPFSLTPSQLKFVEIMVAAEDFCTCCGQYKNR